MTINMAVKQRKKVRLVDIAKHSGVSVSAVSMALSDSPQISSDSKRKIEQVSIELGYRHSGTKTNDSGKELRFGYLLVGTKLNDVAHTEGIEELSNYSIKMGFRLEVACILDISNKKQLYEQLAGFAGSLDGLIISGRIDEDFLRKLDSLKKPWVSHGHLIAECPEKCVKNSSGHIIAPNETESARRGVEAFLKRGLRKLAFVTEVMPKNMSHERWLRGYYIAQAECGVPIDKSLVFVSGQKFSGAAPAVDYFQEKGIKPDGYICPDARITSTLIDTLNQRGIEFDELSILTNSTAAQQLKYGIRNCAYVVADYRHTSELLLCRLHESYKSPRSYLTEELIPSKIENL